MKNTFLALCAAIACLFTLAACSTTTPVSLGIELAGIDRSTGRATLRLLNPGVVAYNVASSKHRVFIDGKAVGTVEVKAPEGVPAQRNVEQTGIFVPEKGASIASGQSSYRLESVLTLTLYGENTQQTKISGSGTVIVK